MAKVFSVYVVTCHVTGLRYVGATSGPVGVRWKQHIKGSRNDMWRGRRHGCSAFWEAIKAYGAGEFSIEAVASATTYDDLKALEIIMINQLGTVVPYGYNLVLGTKKHPDMLKRMSVAQTVRWARPEERAKVTGRPRADNVKKQISTSHKARTSAMSAEERAALTMMASAGRRGKPFTDEQKAQLSAAQRARWSNPEEKAKMAAIHKARWQANPMTEQERERRSDAQRSRRLREQSTRVE